MTLVAALTVTSMMAQTDAKPSTQDQKKMDPTEMATNRTNEMVKKYGLTTEQAAKVKTLNEKYMGKMGGGQKADGTDKTAKSKASKTSSKNTSGQKPQAGNQGEPDMTAYNTELKAILSDSQYKSYETEMAKRKSECAKNNKDSKTSKSNKTTKSSKKAKSSKTNKQSK